MEKDGDRDRKNCHKLFVDAVYTSYDRETTPPAAGMEAKSKPKTKNARLTRLDRTTQFGDGDLSSDMELDEWDHEEDELLPSKGKTSRESITSQQLYKKATRDTNLEPVEYTRKQIFARHACYDEDCNNFRGCCYVLKQRKSHHKVNLKEQEQWARLVGVNDISIDTPPTEWIANYIEGRNEMGRKRRSGKKVDPATTITTTLVDPLAAKAVEVHYYNLSIASYPPTAVHP